MWAPTYAGGWLAEWTDLYWCWRQHRERASGSSVEASLAVGSGRVFFAIILTEKPANFGIRREERERERDYHREGTPDISETDRFGEQMTGVPQIVRVLEANVGGVVLDIASCRCLGGDLGVDGAHGTEIGCVYGCTWKYWFAGDEGNRGSRVGDL